jgi:four helix bundle protein
MHNINNLRVFKQARKNLRTITEILNLAKNFGDLRNQIQRAAISVVSNIAEGAGSGTDKQWKKFLNIARGSNNELHAQILIISDLHPNKDLSNITEKIEYVGKMLTRLIQKIE